MQKPPRRAGLSKKPPTGFPLGPHGEQALNDGQTDGEQGQSQAEEQKNVIAGDGSQPRAHPGDDLRDSASDSGEDVTQNGFLQGSSPPLTKYSTRKATGRPTI